MNGEELEQEGHVRRLKKISYDTRKRGIHVKREGKIRYDTIKRRIDRYSRMDAVGDNANLFFGE